MKEGNENSEIGSTSRPPLANGASASQPRFGQDEFADLDDRNNLPGDLLNPEALKAGLLSRVAEDPRLGPFLKLLDAEENDVDPSSPEVQLALQEMRVIASKEPTPVRRAPNISTSIFRLIPDASRLKISAVKVSGKDNFLFSNWGQNVNYTPSYTLEVETIEGLCEVVKWAKREGKKVRVSGFRHTWSDLYGENGSVNVMLLPYQSLVELPYQLPENWTSELSGINIVESVAGRSPPAKKAFCKVMAGTTNGEFRSWCFDHKRWCLPFNVIMLEVTFGGTNAPICHGAGLDSRTLSDLVVEVSYVDANGNIQTVNDPAELRAASGGFGLLGIVISVTLELDEMSVAEMAPSKLLLPLAIPPPKNYALPEEVKAMIRNNNITQSQLEEARQAFVKRCENDDYLEWFWFPYNERVWVNTWKKRPMTSQDMHLQEFPGNGIFNGSTAQEWQSTLAEIITHFPPWKRVDPQWQAWLFGVGSMVALPNVTESKDTIKTYVSEALHFRRGIQNFRCWDMEWEIPIPSKNSKRDYETIQRAWWDGISAMYARKDAPVRVALEMRLTGGSDVILAPQRGNDEPGKYFGTASIEVLTTLITPREQWLSFCQQMTDKWTSYTDVGGNLLNARPHWAKEWKGLQVHGKPIEQYFKEDAYKTALPEFKETFKKIVEARGSTVEETRKRFGNATLERLVYE